MKYYHAAPKETMLKIVREGRIRKSWDGVVYLCDEEVDSCKFLIIRGMRKCGITHSTYKAARIKKRQPIDFFR